MKNFKDTIISQYANSATLVQLIENMNGYIDPQADLDAFYDFVWNVETAQAWGLDIWGKIVDVSRALKVPAVPNNFGFKESTGSQPFGQAPFYAGLSSTGTYLLSDDAYRILILVKALANITDCSSRSLNQLLQNLFKGRGKAYVNDLGGMQMRYTFEFYLQPYELAIITQSGALPSTAGVTVFALQADAPNGFGFKEAGVFQPFGYGTFQQGVLNVSS